jgi:hypothetical protein
MISAAETMIFKSLPARLQLIATCEGQLNSTTGILQLSQQVKHNYNEKRVPTRRRPFMYENNSSWRCESDSARLRLKCG